MTAGVAASGAKASYYYVQETAYGVTPTAPAFLPIRLASFGLQLQTKRIATAELRTDRHRATSRAWQQTVSGDIECEMSYGSFDDLIAAAMCASWSTDTLKTGSTSPSFSILERNTDISLDTIYTGCQVNQMKLACPLQGKVTLTFSMVGSGQAAYTVPTGATFGDASTTEFMTTFDGSLTLGGTAFKAATAFDLTLANNITAEYELFATDAYGMNVGIIDLSGDLSTYIEDDTLKQAFRNEIAQSFGVTLTDKSTGGNQYLFTVPNAQFATAQNNYNGAEPIIQQFDWNGLLDTTTSTELEITRTAVT